MTTLTRRDPFSIELPAWMDRFFDERLLNVFDGSTLRIEEFTDEDALVVRAEMPGVDIDNDVDIWVHDGLLHIEARRSEKEERKDKTSYRSEFRYGAFTRTVPLPPGATVDDVKATYQDGVLEIRIPTSKAYQEATKVPVQRLT